MKPELDRHYELHLSAPGFCPVCGEFLRTDPGECQRLFDDWYANRPMNRRIVSFEAFSAGWDAAIRLLEIGEGGEATR